MQFPDYDIAIDQKPLINKTKAKIKLNNFSTTRPILDLEVSLDRAHQHLKLIR